MKTLVMKFGGASLETPKHFFEIAALVAEKRPEYDRLVIVVSAMKGMTDHLLSLAGEVANEPPKRELDMLISVGERVSMSLLAMALEERGVAVVSLTGSQSGVITCNRHHRAIIQSVRPYRIEEHLSEGKVVIVAGFQGISHEKEITTLGRGGSDVTAVALGAALDAEQVEFYKDVKGVYSDDPKSSMEVELFSKLSFEKALAISPSVLHKRAILLASKNGLPLHVKSFKKALIASFPGTRIGEKTERKGPFYEDDDNINRSPSCERSACGKD